MTHETTYHQEIDGQFRITAEWSIEYRCNRGCPGDRIDPADGDELEIVSKSLISVAVWLDPKHGSEVVLNETYRGAQRELAELLDDELLMVAVEEHWIKYGCDAEMEHST